MDLLEKAYLGISGQTLDELADPSPKKPIYKYQEIVTGGGFHIKKIITGSEKIWDRAFGNHWRV